MDQDVRGADRPGTRKVTCRTCRAELAREGTHLRVAFGQVQICHAPAGYFRLELGAGGDSPSGRRRRRRRDAAA